MSGKISRPEVDKIANLARLELSEAEKEKYAEELGAILSYIDKLKEVDTENTAITSQVNGLSNILREDKVAASEDFVQLVKMAPEHEDGLIRVKAVFE